MAEQDPVQRYLAAKQQAVSAMSASDPVAAYQAMRGPITRGHSKLTAKQLQRRADQAVDEAAAEEPSGAVRALGTVAALASDIPGAEALQAHARAVVRHQPYRTALDEIRGAESDAPAYTRIPAKIAGGALAVSAIPGGPTLQGARYGVASGLLEADPGTLEDRLHDAALRGTVGAVAGKATGVVSDAIRSRATATLGSQAMRRKAQMTLEDALNFGRAETEGATAALPLGPGSDLAQALSRPDVAPLAEAVRASRQFAGADDATVLREVHRRLSEQQGGLIDRLANAVRARPSLSGESLEIKLAKDELKNAADPIMPSFRGAVARHAEMASKRDAMQTSADAMRRAIRGTSVAGKKLTAQSPEALDALVGRLSPEEATAGLEGALGRVRESMSITSPLRTLRAVNRSGPILRLLEKRAGRGGASRFLRSGAVAELTP